MTVSTTTAFERPWEKLWRTMPCSTGRFRDSVLGDTWRVLSPGFFVSFIPLRSCGLRNRGFAGLGLEASRFGFDAAIGLQEALHLELNWFSGGMESPGQFGSVINAIAAVATGLCRHVVCFRTVWESTAQGGGGRRGIGGGGGGGFRVSGSMQWTLPFSV